MEYSELIMGSMYSGKSEELKRRIKRYTIAGKNCVIFKPSLDDRYSKNSVLTHDAAKVLKQIDNETIKEIISENLGMVAFSVKDSNELLQKINEYGSAINVVGIDEVQFFDDNIIQIIKKLNKRNIRVVMSALDLYASGEPLPITARLSCLSKYVDKLHAVCVDCGNEAAYSFKIDNNNDNHESKIDIGSEGKYVALCEKCREKRENK